MTPHRTCAFESCWAVQFKCCLPGGCVTQRFGPAPVRRALVPVKDEGLRDDAPALNGVLPARTDRDPWFTKRRRKALT